MLEEEEDREEDEDDEEEVDLTGNSHTHHVVNVYHHNRFEGQKPLFKILFIYEIMLVYVMYGPVYLFE